MAVHDFELLNCAVLAVDGVQTDGAGDARLARQRRINRLNTVDDSGCLDVAANADRTGRSRPRWGRRSAHASDNTTEHATHGATGNAARNSAAHASGHVGLGVFLNNFDFLGNDLRGHQLARIHQMGLRLDMDHLSRRGRRRRWRRRRRRGEHGGHHGFGKRLGVNQRNKNQNHKKQALEQHRDQDRPRLVGLLWIRTGNHHFFKHGSYLLPAGARRPETFSLPRALLPAAGPVPATKPWPRQRFQATTRGAAIPKLEYVPTTIPTTRAKEKARSTWPPIRNRTSTVRKVRPLVKIVRDKVWLMDLLTTAANDSRRNKRLFSRMRSKMTMVSFIEYPTRVRSAAIKDSGGPVHPLESEGNIYQHARQSIEGNENGLPSKLSAHFGAHNRHIANGKAAQRVIAFQSGQHRRRDAIDSGELIEVGKHTTLVRVAISQNFPGQLRVTVSCIRRKVQRIVGVEHCSQR